MTKRTLKVLCNLNTPTPLQDILNTGSSGTWRIRQSDLDECTHFEVYDETTKNKVGGEITSYELVNESPTMGKGFVIHFTPKEIGGHLVRSYGSTRPKFNRIVWTID